MSSSKKAKRILHAVAEAQAGYFTAKQAQAAGFSSSSSHAYHLRVGDWVREYRGIYRLTGFPTPPQPELIRWHLWSMNRARRAQGVYSHSTALSLYLFPDKVLGRAMPPELPEGDSGRLEWMRPLPIVQKVHMTVPMGFRRSGAVPEGLMLHYADLPRSDIAAQVGYRTTTPLRTILDLASAKAMPRAELSAALQVIVNRGLITRVQVKNAKVPREVREILQKLLKWKRQ